MALTPGFLLLFPEFDMVWAIWGKGKLGNRELGNEGNGGRGDRGVGEKGKWENNNIIMLYIIILSRNLGEREFPRKRGKGEKEKERCKCQEL
jgi:hypothetical protein